MSETEEENKFYVYIYYDPSRNNEPFYVGKGHGRRAWQHLSIKKTHPFIQRLGFLKKNNITPNIGFYSGLDEELSLLLEIELIQHIGRKDKGKGPLLNLTDGGEGSSGIKISKDTRVKLSIAKRGKKMQNRHQSSSHKGMIKEINICPHCSKKGGKGAMQRWHFDNCKEKLLNV